MLKAIKIILIFFIVLFFMLNFSYATETENNLTTANIDHITPMPTLPEADLGLSNILSILLISVGVLIILLAIAILIRLKHM